jgi:hypothetical protein
MNISLLIQEQGTFGLDLFLSLNATRKAATSIKTMPLQQDIDTWLVNADIED